MARAEHSPHLGMQYEDMEQQSHTAEIGMWGFLTTEILFFGVLFACYTMMRMRWPEAFKHGSEDLYLSIGGVNTAVLLTSSTFVALAVRAAKMGRNKALMTHLAITATLGMVFIGLKASEYYLDYQEGLVPGVNFTTISPEVAKKPPEQQNPRPQQEKMFMIFYFIMTGFHALHMMVGVGLLTTLFFLARRGMFSPSYHSPVEICALYWHFVDIVWVFLYPALYLLRQS